MRGLRARRGELGAFVPFALLGAANFGMATAAFSGLIMAANETVPAVPAIGLGTGATIVAGLAGWIVRKALSGEITPLKITELVDTMQTLIEKQDKLIEALTADRAELRAEMKQSTQAQFAVNDWLRRQNAATQVPPPRTPTT